MNALDRFVEAQAGVIDAVRAELRDGRKTSHWMWFVFPQLRGLGRSSTARHYGIADRAEAAAYAHHPVLGPRLLECTDRVLTHPGSSAHRIFGSPDDLKFASCMTLFEAVWPNEPGFARALDTFYGGRRDSATLGLLA